MRKRSLETGFWAHVSALTKLASPLACVGVLISHLVPLFNIPHQHVFLCVYSSCVVLSLAGARWIDIPSLPSLTVKLCRQLLLRRLSM